MIKDLVYYVTKIHFSRIVCYYYTYCVEGQSYSPMFGKPAYGKLTRQKSKRRLLKNLLLVNFCCCIQDKIQKIYIWQILG
jgi:hypothetical protein